MSTLSTELRSETEVFSKMIESMRTAEGYARALAHLRSDVRWIKVAGNLNTVQQKLIRLAQSKVRVN